MHVGEPLGAGYPAVVPVVAEKVHQQHTVAGHVVYRTWGESVELNQASVGARTAHPGLAAGAVAAGAGGAHAVHFAGATAADAEGGTSSRTPTTHVHVAEVAVSLPRGAATAPIAARHSYVSASRVRACVGEPP
ncbi:hypothetical protein CYMTET_13865 [Cymbomonas tetramitiformis]|uniref:Uncharacterized protein n=1 Tax=Cymbomonas tetramitiformis TaxID=36881 RepID=A0AAE0LAZ1_9CHLO|nr:hypothetical protein CYMTET_13865 [Cymbomonas tetramitiformis]